MKIVLHAFENKLSGVMEIPEETSHRFSLVMSQPVQVYKAGLGVEHPMMNQPLAKKCVFEWTGSTYYQEGHPYHGARVYQLVAIE